jgi:large conductance mechanosensitive channel
VAPEVVAVQDQGQFPNLRRHMKGFRTFLLRGNVVDLAVGIVIGAAFTAVVTSFVKSFLTPLVGAITGKSDLAKRVYHHGTGSSQIVFTWGDFVSNLITFVIVAAVIYFLVVLPVNRLMERFKTEPDSAAPTKTCQYCLSAIPEAASKCAFCTADLAVA